MKTKYLIFLGMMIFMPRHIQRVQFSGQITYIKNKSCLEIERPDIESRITWDKNQALLRQYVPERKVGDFISFKIFGKTRVRKIKEICYLTKGQDSSVLDSVYSRIVIHHTAIEWNKSAVKQIKFICEGEILDKNYKFSDIAYHFFIASDGTILEGRPLSHMGTHAGKIVEKDISLDPDYGSIGIVLMGNFDKNEPYRCQKESLIKLLNWLKFKYLIPNSGILYHHEVKGLVEEACLTSLSKHKTCPGRQFPEKKEILNKLMEDIYESCSKKTSFGR